MDVLLKEEKELWREDIKKGIFDEFNSQHSNSQSFDSNLNKGSDFNEELKSENNSKNEDIDDLLKEISEEFDLKSANKRLSASDDLDKEDVEKESNEEKNKKSNKTKKDKPGKTLGTTCC